MAGCFGSQRRTGADGFVPDFGTFTVEEKDKAFDMLFELMSDRDKVQYAANALGCQSGDSLKEGLLPILEQKEAKGFKRYEFRIGYAFKAVANIKVGVTGFRE